MENSTDIINIHLYKPLIENEPVQELGSVPKLEKQKRTRKLIINRGDDSPHSFGKNAWAPGARGFAKKHGLRAKDFKAKERSGWAHRKRYRKTTKTQIIYRYEIFREITIIDVKRKLGLPIRWYNWIGYWLD